MLPLIVRLFPDLVKHTFARGKIVVLNDIDPTPDSELDRFLARKIAVRRKRHSEDDTQVVKVADAVGAVEDAMNKKGLVRDFALGAINTIIGTVGGSTVAGQNVAQAICDEIRSKALRQDTPKIKNVKIREHRPARGHGRGGRHF
jgi:hypothetical protein